MMRADLPAEYSTSGGGAADIGEEGGLAALLGKDSEVVKKFEHYKRVRANPGDWGLSLERLMYWVP